MRKILAHLLPLALGVICGLAATEGIAYAQSSPVKIHADPANACIWKQGDVNGGGLAEVQAIKMTATFDNAAGVSVTQTCTGSASPFDCAVLIPMANQTLGVHTVSISGQGVDPVDGSLTTPTVLIAGSYDVTSKPLPPASGSGFRIGKLVGGIITLIAVALAFFHFGH